MLEKKEENCVTTVNSFFKEKLKIEEDVGVCEAYRVGRGKSRTMMVKLDNPRKKGFMFANVKNLKDVTNDEGKYFQIREQFTAKWYAMRKRNNMLIKENQSKMDSVKLNMEREKGQLKVNGVPYQKKIRPPSCREILQASKDRRMQQFNCEVVRGNPVRVEGQIFTGYTLAVATLEEVNTAYAIICAMHTNARHVMGVCRLPGRDFHQLQDFVDDDEHGGGEILLRFLTECDMMNRAVFVVRIYDGRHIGAKRYNAILNAAKSAVNKGPFNRYLNRHQYPWTVEE